MQACGWLGDALVAKPLGMLAKTAPVAKGLSFLPKAITPALGTGARAGATYGLGIAPMETALQGDGLQGLIQREKQVPLMALGGTALHGAGQLLGNGVKSGVDYARFNKATQLPEISTNPLADLQGAYNNPVSLRTATEQQLNNTFSDSTNNLGQTGRTLSKQGMDPSELLQQKQADTQSAFGRPTYTDNPQAINKKQWYHGTGTQGLTPEALNTNMTKIDGLFGQGVYLTDNPEIANGYAESRSKKTNTPTIYNANVDVKNVLDLQKTLPDDAFNVISKTANQISQNYDNPELVQSINKLHSEGATGEKVWLKLSDEISTMSHQDQIPISEFHDYFDNMTSDLKQTGYDAYTHTGGQRTGKDPHQVLIMLDPNGNVSPSGKTGQITKFEPTTILPKTPQQILDPNFRGSPPEKPQPLQWTNKDNLGQSGPLPIRSITPDNLDQLPGRQPAQIQGTTNNLQNLGFGQPVIEPRIPMSLQRFSNELPATLPDTASHIVSKTERQPTNLETLRTNAYIKTTDNLHRFNQLDQYVEKVTGSKLAPQDKTYMLGLNSRGTGSTSSHILEQELVNPEGVKIGDSLKTITNQLKNSKDMQSFDDYLVNKHAITRMKAGEKVYPDEMAMTPEISEAKVKEIEAAHPEFKDLSNKLYDFQNKLTKSWLVDTGIVSPEEYGKWVIDNPNYVPNNRFFSELEKPGFGLPAKRGFAGQSNPVKARTGSQRKIISPIETIMEHTEQYVKVARRNEVMQSLIRNIEKNPEEFKGWAEVIPSDSQLKEGMLEDINKTLETQGIDGVVEAFNKQFDDVFSAKKQRLDLGNVVTGLVNGEKVHVRVNDPLLLDALTNLKPQAQKNVIAALGSVTRVMKNLTTGINPVFGLARNIWRDIPTAFINSKSTNNPLVFGKDLLGSIVDIMGNKEVYKSYKAMGGGYASSSVSASRNTLAESKARLLPSTLSAKHPLQTAKELVTHPLRSSKKMFDTGIGTLERFNNVVESAPRLAEFKRVSKPGTYDAKIKGLYEANDVTTNFSRSGNVIKDADAVFPYLNAAWQGIDKLARTFKDNPVQAPIKAVAAVTFPTIVLYQLNHNNPAYQQLSDYIKDNNFLFPKADGTFIKIPKPREIGVMFGSSVERSLRQWQDSDPDAFNRFMETVKTNFTPPTRSILAPLSDIRSNKNFLDAPVVSSAVSKLSPKYQFDEKTSEPAKWIGNKLNQSPQQIDYLARSYLGGVAQLGIPATTKNASIGGTLKKQVTADPTFSNDIIGDFYNTLDKISTSASDAKATGDKGLELGHNYKTMFNKTSTKLGDIRKQIDKVQAGTLTSEEKDAQIKTLQIRMLEIAKAANDKFKLK